MDYATDRANIWHPYASAVTPPPVLGASAVAQLPHIAAQALARQGIAFVDAELDRLGRRHHCGQIVFVDIAQKVLGIHEMVAAVHIAVVLHHRIAAASLREAASAGLHSAPVGKGTVEEINEGPAHVVRHPVVEDIAEEPAEAHGAHGPGSERGALHRRVHYMRTGALVGLPVTLRIHHMLHHRRELYIVAPQALKELIDLQPPALRSAVDGGHNVVLRSGLIEFAYAFHHPVQGRSAAAVASAPFIPSG